MDKFKIKSLNDYGYEMAYANELCKSKLKSNDKRYIKKLSRTRLKRDLLKIKNKLEE